MAKTVGIGVIGMGWMGQVHSRSYNLIKDRFYEDGIEPRLIICSDNVEARAKESAERFGFKSYTTNWHEVIANPEVQAINVATPNGLHFEINKAIAAAGKPILCEKPVGRNPDETIGSYEAAKAAGIITFVGFNYRWAPVVQYAKQIIDSGELGEITHYHGRFLNGYAGDPNGFLTWRFLAEQGLGTLGDLMSHAIDMAHMLNGEVDKLVSSKETFIQKRPIPQPGVGTHYDVATGKEPQGDVTNEDYVGALVRYKNGARGTLEACRIINGEKCNLSFEIHGTKGAIKWNFEQMNELLYQQKMPGAQAAQDGYKILLSGPAHPYHHHFNPGWGVDIGFDDLKVIEAYNFLKSVTSGKQIEPSFKAAYDVAVVQKAIMQSWESEGWETVQY
ncbi:MAG TPA: Gfo/Idh/MocA family oxidoreductase [Phototrophicaceae bacterium]|nr:Gfo/Idh/MocA family oxidoreductase [Phototrophicaceae bacterium]